MTRRRTRAGEQIARLRSAARGAALLAATAAAACAGGTPDPVTEQEHTHAGGGVVTLWTDSLELFMEYPPHVAGQASDPWAIHLTWLESWRPVREGRLALRFRGPGGATEDVVADAPARPGIFTPTATLPSTGTWRLDMILSAGGRAYPVPVGQLEVFASEDALPHEEEEPVPAGAIVFLKERQWEIPFRVVETREREIPASVRAAGEIVPPSDALARVSAPVEGLVVADGPALAPGDPVRSGQTLAFLAPTSADDSYAALRGRVERLEREVARAERLVAAEAIAERRLVEARHALEVARAALEAVGGPEAVSVATDGADEGAYRYRLRSPIDGVVAERHLAPGERLAAGAPAFTIVDPRTVWVRLHVPATAAARASAASGASFTAERGSRVHRAERVVSVGSVIDPETRTLPVLLSLPNPEQALKLGMMVEGRLFLGEPTRGLAIPAAAVQDEDGLDVAYVEVGGESFERRVLELGPTDGEWTIVRSGIGPGERVVATGAYQVRLASLGEDAPTDHGHPH